MYCALASYCKMNKHAQIAMSKFKYFSNSETHMRLCEVTFRPPQSHNETLAHVGFAADTVTLWDTQGNLHTLDTPTLSITNGMVCSCSSSKAVVRRYFWR